MLDEGFSGHAGNVLDPCLSLRTVLELAPGAEGDALFVLGLADDRDAALALLEGVNAPVMLDIEAQRIARPTPRALPNTTAACSPRRATAPNCCSSRTATAASARTVPNTSSACRRRPMGR